MKITLDTSTLSRELFKLQGVVNSKGTMPILQNALIEASDSGELTLHATDLDVSVTTTSECEVSQPGRITVRARDLYDVVKNLKGERVTLEKEDNQWMRLTSDTVRVRFVGMNPDEFPQVQRADEVQFVPLPTDRFMRMIDRTIFSISTDEGRPNLTGALFKKAGADRISMVSTDGHRLSMISAPVDAEGKQLPSELEDGVIIPRKGLAELRRTVDLTAPEISFGLRGNNVVVRHENTTMFVRVIDGNFPNFDQVIPESKKERMAYVDRATLIDRIKFVSLFSNTKTHNVRIELEEATCTISAQDPDKGECEEKVQAAYDSETVQAGYNYRYVLDVLNVIGGEQVALELVDTLSPTLIHELDSEEGERSLFIVMPMRI